jgi:hypothetical protein
VPAKAFPLPSRWHHAAMSEPRKAPRIQIVCGTWGSTDVSRDARGDWDVRTQRWELRTVFDYAFCHACDAETRLEEIPIEG